MMIVHQEESASAEGMCLVLERGSEWGLPCIPVSRGRMTMFHVKHEKHLLVGWSEGTHTSCL
jgi:hypothetical protein